jgi:AraC family transcriptional regulator of adaptative response / DNA-3-methyladenine glycosylase II
VYRRSIALDGAPGMLEISAGGPDHLLLRAHLPYWEGLIHVVGRAARIAGVDDESGAGAAALAADPVIGDLVRARPGLRMPGPWSDFETAVATVAGPAEAAALVHRLGQPVAGLGAGLTHLFPSPAAVAEATSGTVRAVARAAEAGDLLPGRIGQRLRADLAPDDADDIALRLGDRDAFPARRLQAALDARGISAAETTAWRPWRGLAATYLLTGSATEAAA